MSPEIITAVFGGLVTLLGAWNTRQGRRLKQLEEQVGALTTWKAHAMKYIASLVFFVRSNGLEPPEPPTELELTVPPAEKREA